MSDASLQPYSDNKYGHVSNFLSCSTHPAYIHVFWNVRQSKTFYLSITGYNKNSKELPINFS